MNCYERGSVCHIGRSTSPGGHTSIRTLSTLLCLLVTVAAPAGAQTKTPAANTQSAAVPADPGGESASVNLEAVLSEGGDQIRVIRRGQSEPILVQNATPDFRPYIHPIAAPDGQGLLTEFSPNHHRHQTGLYWGFTRVNGRDYFHHPEGEYWKRVSVTVLKGTAANGNDSVQWQTVYDLLGEAGDTVLQETQVWSLSDKGDRCDLELQWTGEAQTDVTIGEYDYGGLFLRMPWSPGTPAHVVNSARQTDLRAEGQRAVWLDVGMQVPGRTSPAHIAIFDHAENPGFPLPWRVDSQFGVGPVRARLGDWRIRKGEATTIRHKLVVYTGEADDVVLTDMWSDYTGQRMAWAQWQLAQQEGRRAEFLTPEKAVAGMTLQPGFQANVFAAEPMITQPMAFCWDDRGRLWIAENRDYESRGDGFSNDGNSRILILEDTDRDGTADKRSVFLEGIAFPAAIAVGMDGLWLGAPPNLLFVPDRDHDDRADADDIEVRLTGWGIRDRHETLNSLHWGPDGWLYGCQGYATPSKVGKPAGQGRLYRHKDPFPADTEFAETPVDINGGVWRYHPIKDRFEVVAHGFSNPWGIDYDAHGQLFITACVIPHLWHVVPGGIYHRQGGSHFSPYVYSDIRTIADHRHRSAHGGARVYLSDAFPSEYRGRIFMANIHEHAVLTDILEPRGSGFVGRHGDDFALANNAQWVGFSMEIGPDGAVYALDWHDADICGKEVLNKETGRVFRFAPKQSAAVEFPDRFADLNTLSDLRLTELQLVDSAWHARRARVILQHRATQRSPDAAAVTQLRTILQSGDTSARRLNALWALHVCHLLTGEELTGLLRDDDAWLRAWSIQLLCEDRDAPQTALDTFVAMAKSDPSPVVRLYLASAMSRIPDKEVRLQLAEQLCRHADDVGDHNIPKMIWFGLEPLVTQNPQRALQLASASQIPLVTRHIGRRLADAEMYEPLLQHMTETAAGRHDLLLGLRDAVEGRFDMAAPQGWEAVAVRLRDTNDPDAALVRQLSQQFGDTVASRDMLATLANSSADPVARQTALQGLAGRRRPELRTRLPQLFTEPSLRIEAIRACAAYDDEGLGKVLLEQYPRYSAEERLEVIHALASRPTYGRQLTAAIRSGHVPRRDVPAYVARLLQRVVGNGFLEVWGAVEGLTADKEAQFVRYRALLTPDAVAAADPSAGRALFHRTCSACHRMYGEGGMIGPEITGANRSNLEYLLSNILTPSAVIQDAYKMQIILMDDGRVYSGIPASENDRQLRLRVAGIADPITIAKSQIESREVAPVSMMPEGMLN
ncbi:MAG: PmoA family protein, partial [Planctomycetaceae bacterium]|nr:PmoA family protein [Planctomycetaceae bacterium]